MTTTRDDRIALFANLQDPASQQQFWDRVADDVDWTVEGTHPLAGRYHNKSQFIEATFTRLAGVLPDGVKLEVKHLYIDGDTTITELHSTSTTNEGADFANTYCWVCRVADGKLTELIEYLDTELVATALLPPQAA